jgi:hypothetical protein
MKTLHDAVFVLYTNSVTVRGNDIDSLVAIDSNENLIELNKSAITSKLGQLQAEETAKQQAEVVAKQSALSKLTALGLTADEVKAMLGTA